MPQRRSRWGRGEPSSLVKHHLPTVGTFDPDRATKRHRTLGPGAIVHQHDTGGNLLGSEVAHLDDPRGLSRKVTYYIGLCVDASRAPDLGKRVVKKCAHLSRRSAYLRVKQPNLQYRRVAGLVTRPMWSGLIPHLPRPFGKVIYEPGIGFAVVGEHRYLELGAMGAVPLHIRRAYRLDHIVDVPGLSPGM